MTAHPSRFLKTLPPNAEDRLGELERETLRLQAVLEDSTRDRRELADFFENAAMPLHCVGPDGTILRANQAELDLLGYSRDEYVGRHIAEFHADQPVIQDILRRLGDAEVLRDCPARLRCKDGSIKDVLITSSVYWEDGRFIYARCLTRDITDLKRAEQALQDNERRLREVIDALPAAIYTTDAEGRLTHFNPAAVEFSGRVPELGTDQWCVSFRLYHADGTPMPHDQCPMAIALKEGRIVRGVQAIAERPDGTRIWFEPYPTPLRDETGRVIGGVNLLLDITHRKQAEQARALLAAIVDSSDDAIISKDLNSIITSWNDSAERLFGYTVPEAVGQPVTILIPPDRLHEEPTILGRLKRGERIDHFETIRLRKDGSPIDISLTISPIRDAAGRIVGASKVARDITQRKRTELLVNAQRQALQLLAEGAPLEEVLEFLIGVVEQHSPEGMLASIVPLNEAGTHFQRGIGASLPEAFNAAVEGVEVSSPTGLCARAVTLGQAVAVQDFRQGAEWQGFAQFVAPYGLRSGWSSPIVSASGEVLGTFANYYRRAGDPTPKNRELVEMVLRTAAIAIQRTRAEHAATKLREQLAADLAGMQRLQEISTRLVHHGDMQSLLGEILDAAIEITGADLGNIQLLDETTGALSIAVQHGFGQEFLDFCNSVHGGMAACGTAMERGRRIIVEDVASDPIFPGPAREVMLRAGALAVQSTPLVGRSGELLGMLSTHYRSCRRPDERDLQRLDLLARQAAELIERAQVAEALTRSEERFRAIVNQATSGVAQTDLTGRFTLVNQRYCTITGYSVEELLQLHMQDITHPDDLPNNLELFTRLASGGPDFVIEKRYIRKDGSTIWVNNSVGAIRDASGRPRFAVAVVLDISERKRAEEELRASEERHRALVTATSSIVWTVDATGAFVVPQVSWEEYTGQAWEAHRGFGWIEAVHPDDRETVMTAWAVAHENQTPYEARGRLWCAGLAQYRHFVARAAPVVNLDGSIAEWIGMCTDIEVQWQAEERLRDMERIESVGRLAGGVAHEVNNQMTVALGCADYLLRRSDLPPTAVSDVRHIRQAAERSAAITQQLLAFGRRQMLRLEAVDLNVVLTDLSTVLRRTLGTEVAVEFHLAAPMCSVVADVRQLQQVLINLALNARDAMPRGGTLRLETSHVMLPETVNRIARAPELKPGAYCLLTVSDTGHGMDEEILGQIFEPFFTTKPFGQGNGLGLASVYGIVKQSGGDIAVESEPGRGTTFRLYFPQGAAAQAEGQPAAAIDSPGYCATVLVAEDDEAVRAMMCRTLRDEGHHVLEAADGQEAIDLLAGSGSALDLLVADVAMPRMGGLELSEQLAQLRPGVPTLFISGYPGSEVVARGLLRDGLPSLNKPFSPDALAMRVRQLLSASAQQQATEQSAP